MCLNLVHLTGIEPVYFWLQIQLVNHSSAKLIESIRFERMGEPPLRVPLRAFNSFALDLSANFQNLEERRGVEPLFSG
jgi:hypothetical protein